MIARLPLYCGYVLLAFLSGIALRAKPLLIPAGLAGFGQPLASPANPADIAPDPGEEATGPAHYDSLPAPLPPNLVALDFEATGTSEFGDLVRLGSSAHYIEKVTVTMSSGALRSDYASHPTSPFGFTHPVTLKLFGVDRSGGAPRPGELIASITRRVLIPWRPEPDLTSTSPLRPWKAADGNYYAGLAFNLTFELGGAQGALPDEVIYTISFNTQHEGPAPIGLPGPYNALRIALSERAPQPGIDVEPDAVFWRNRVANDAAASAASLAVPQRDTGWTPYRPAVRFTNSSFGAIAETVANLRTLQTLDRARSFALRDAATLVGFALPRGFWDGNTRLHLGEGEVVFSALADAAEDLGRVATSDDPVAPATAQSLRALERAAQNLAEATLGDAILSGGSNAHIFKAQDALEEAGEHVSAGRAPAAIEAYAEAWREAQRAIK